MNKLLTIIIPTYNMETLLDKCLTSLILDTKELRERLDVIVAIDGATDQSSEIAHRYADRYPEMFSVIDKENGNYGSCINAALPRVKGKYVRILDADDTYNTKELPAYLDVLEQQDVELVLTDFETVDDKGEILSATHFFFDKMMVLPFSVIPSNLFIKMHSVAYKSDIFQRINYCQTEGASYTDAEWVFHPMAAVNNMYYYNHTIYRYLVGRDGQTVNPTTILKRLSHVEKSLWTMLNVYRSIPNSNQAKEYMLCAIRRRIGKLYVFGLDKQATYDLVTFDKKLLRDYPEIYCDTNNITLPVGVGKIQMPIIKMWRRVKSKRGLYLFPLYDLYVIMNKIHRVRN